MKLSIKKFAELTGVSVRTLHYYDETGLLKPDFVDSQNGYRFYGYCAFYRMQEILFYRELDFSLKEIGDILSSPNYNKQEALRSQKQLLLMKKQRLEGIIEAIGRAENGEMIDMSKFDNSEFEMAKDSYRDEAKKRWGETDAYKENRIKTSGYTKEKWNAVGEGLNAIIAEFAKALASGVKPADEEATELAEKLRDYITETQYTCTDEILACLGEMYVGDERFKANIDRHGEGTAEFINNAIKACCEKK